MSKYMYVIKMGKDQGHLYLPSLNVNFNVHKWSILKNDIWFLCLGEDQSCECIKMKVINDSMSKNDMLS